MNKILTSLLLIFSLGLLLAVQVAAQDDIIEINFVHIFSDDLRPLVIQEIIDEFETIYPNVRVNSYSTNADSDYNEIFLSALDNADLGQAPNVVQVESGLTQQAVDFGYFVPISELATEEQLASLDDILPSVLGSYVIDGQLWGLPWNLSNPIMYYNTDAFEAAGLDPDDPPRTFADVTAACEALMAADLGFDACVNWPMSTWFIEQWVSMGNALFVNNGNGRDARATEVFFDSDEVLDAMVWWDELDANGFYTYTGRIGDNNGEGVAFLTQRTPIHINSSAGLTLFQNFAQFGLGVTYLPLPHEDATNGVTVGGGGVWVMIDQTEEEMRASADFVFFLTSTANDIKWHQGTGYIPIRESSYNQLVDEGYYDENPFFFVPVTQLVESQANVATAGAVIGPSTEVRNQLIAASQQILDGNLQTRDEIRAILTTARGRAEAELLDYNLDFE